ncbi:hypothetical protein QJS66_01700 [Kocuria rhizophila]|nr:hypothetical protein QJS66_01700 [Kocuria rhizophila]
MVRATAPPRSEPPEAHLRAARPRPVVYDRRVSSASHRTTTATDTPAVPLDTVPPPVTRSDWGVLAMVLSLIARGVRGARGRRLALYQDAGAGRAATSTRGWPAARSCAPRRRAVRLPNPFIGIVAYAVVLRRGGGRAGRGALRPLVLVAAVARIAAGSS